MRTFFSLFSCFALANGLLAGNQTLNVTPATLAGWAVTGASQSTLAGLPELALPAGAQLARSFNSTDVSVRVSSQPVLGPNSGDWPVLEIGSAALVFSRSGSVGKLVLVVGNNAPVDLPLPFALDADGRSSDVLNVGFARSGSVLTVDAGGQSLQFPAGSDPTNEAEVVVSAGSSEPWILDRLEVTADSSAISPSATVGSGSDQPAATSPAVSGTDSHKPAPQPAFVPAVGGAANSGSTTAAVKTAPVVNASGTLEIFTPASFRHGRLDKVRATAAQSQKN